MNTVIVKEQNLLLLYTSDWHCRVWLCMRGLNQTEFVLKLSKGKPIHALIELP